MIKILSILLLFFSSYAIAFGQQPSSISGAQATLNSYKALYVLNSGDEKKITTTLRNIKNALEDPRLKSKLYIELVVLGDGVKVYKKTEPFGPALRDLQQKGVILAQCENTLTQRKIDKSTLFSFISYVPSANGEIIIRQYEGWAIVYP